MRLSKIKLAGFKSFVDPTTIAFMSNLSAVVGPNGCGKSNVIDAVRWVMGESSAKHLRGGSITDVIFSGSSARKPVGQATVELIFDNAQGKLGGEYSNYSEIAIKRQVTRDGQSNYFLNGQRCRRKDITDIFLGTGLGPRSYAIIEQGMISRVIDAKPEDLRVFIEEAAGISKYKERRKETENRIKHTQENLARLGDLREELGKQLNHLQRQSQAAERYKALKAQESERSAQLAALIWNRLDQEIQGHETQIRETLVALEKEQTGAQQLKTRQEIQRVEHAEASEQLNEVQKRYYGLGAEIAKIEQAIAHHQQRFVELTRDKQDAEETLAKSQMQLIQDEAQIADLEAQIAHLAPEHEMISAEAQMAADVQQEAEMTLEEWREKTAELQQAAIAPTRQAEAEKAKIAQLERQIQQTTERIARLENEKNQLQGADDPADIEILEEKIAQQQLNYEDAVATLEENKIQKQNILDALNVLKPEIKRVQKNLSEAQGQLSALQTLQAAALGKNADSKTQWLQEQGLENQPYLAEKLEVTPGWEIAVETVLEGFLEAIGLEPGKLGSIAQEIDTLKAGMCFVEWQQHHAASHTENALQNTLMQYVKCNALPETLFQLLSRVEVCETLEAAQQRLSSIPENASLITPQGCWLGKGWLKVKAPASAGEEGILHRSEKLKQLNIEMEATSEQLESLQLQLEEHEDKLKEIEIEKETKQQDKNKLQQEIVTLQSEMRIKQSRIEQNQKRYAQIQQEYMQCQELSQLVQQEVNTARGLLHEAVERMSELNEEQEEMSSRKEALTEALTSARLKAKTLQDKMHEVDITLRGYRTQLESLNVNIERSQNQIENAKIKLSNIIESLENNDEPIHELKMDLEVNLEKRIAVEDELNQTRDTVAHVDNALRQIEKDLNQHEQKITSMRDKLERVKMEWQAYSVRRENALEKLKNTDYVLEELVAALPEDADEKAWQEELSDIEQKISRLGAINLAAIEEYEAAKQRKEYLDEQNADLTEALTTLDNAIKKIDKETRMKFKETFDKVNDGFVKRFPILFGGGQASLSMTGEDLLDTGVGIMARPPGKKNSSIQLLSGGEKALTAVALVFSIFELNPAPFCMLDEVDAPLDDSNVGRFCNLVREMSKSVQFIFISHNKLAIEMAEQLQGVTMREPGVSRLVTVDIEEAKSLAEA